MAKKYLFLVWLILLTTSMVATAWAQRSKKKSSFSSEHTRDDARAAAIASARKSSASDPFGFLKGSEQHKKSKDCGCPGTRKGERQRKKEFRSHRKRK